MKKILLLIAMFMMVCAASQAQGTRLYGSNRSKGHVEMLNERVRTIPGYRIQVASLSGTASKNRAFDMKERLREAFPGVEAYVVFDEPNFKVKVGDFRTRLDAYVFLQRIRNEFPGTIIRDNIYPTQINWDEMVPETEDDI